MANILMTHANIDDIGNSAEVMVPARKQGVEVFFRSPVLQQARTPSSPESLLRTEGWLAFGAAPSPVPPMKTQAGGDSVFLGVPPLRYVWCSRLPYCTSASTMYHLPRIFRADTLPCAAIR